VFWRESPRKPLSGTLEESVRIASIQAASPGPIKILGRPLGP
jgi:hypothetical protein